MAALEIGSVRAMPTTTDIMSPETKGALSAAQPMKSLTYPTSLPIYGAVSIESSPPTNIVTKGVTIMSTLVFFETNLPHSAATIVMKRTARGPPAPPSELAAKPTAAEENITRGSLQSVYATAIAMAGPATLWAYPPIWARNPQCGIMPSALKIVPIRSEAKSPSAIAPIASMK